MNVPIYRKTYLKMYRKKHTMCRINLTTLMLSADEDHSSSASKGL
jgi:hypothetical protein